MMEIQVVGKYWIEHELNARILPERLLIQDLLKGTFPGSVPISEEQYQHFLISCTARLTQRSL